MSISKRAKRAVMRAVDWDWTRRADVASDLGLSRDRTKYILAILVSEGAIQEESRGGRVRRLMSTGRPRAMRLKPKIIFNVDPEIIHYLGTLYEPVCTSVLADTLSITKDQADTDLDKLLRKGKVLKLGYTDDGDGLWAGT